MSCGILINYIDRVNISHAILPIAKEFSLSPIEQGFILSAFSWGYVIFMGAGGLLIDRFGAVRISTWAAIVWSIATAGSGAALGYQSLLASRLAVGAGEAPIFPADARIVREEFPLEERGRATALFDAGSYVGTALCAPIVVFAIAYWGWRASFYVCAGLGLFWVILWSFGAPRLIKSNAHSLAVPHKPPSIIEIKKLLVNKKLLGACYGFFCYNYSKSFFLTWFPAYLVTERGFSFLQIGFIGMIPAICAIGGEAMAGYWTDDLIKRGKSVTFARKLPLCLGMMLAGSIGLTEFVSSQWAVLGILSFAFAATIAASPGIWAIPGDIAPKSSYVGTIGGIQNTFSNIAGIVAPIVTGILVAKTGSFALALVVSALITVSGALSYWLVVGTLEPILIETTEQGN